MPIEQSRRRFLGQLGIAGVAGVGGLGIAGFGGGRRSLAAEPPPEITTVTLEKIASTCPAPEYVAETLLRAEGFTDIRYRTRDTNPVMEVARNQIDWRSSCRGGRNRRHGQRRSPDIGRRGTSRLLRTLRT